MFNDDKEKEINPKTESSDNIKEHKSGSLLKSILNWSIYLILVVLISTLVVNYVVQRVGVVGSSMADNLADGDNVFVEKISYRFKDPERYDIIVFPSPDPNDAGSFYIKRIIGLPGETVQISGNNIFINGIKLEENYGTSPMEYAGVAAEPLTLGSDEYFVLGDNRKVSKDSRSDSVGNIHRDDIEGKAFVIIWPLNHAKLLKHQ